MAALRDHYPPTGLERLNIPDDQPFGFYFNFQFTSSGSHVAQAEGLPKMLYTYRAVQARSRRPMDFSIVNVGNIREHLNELSGNAAMMWDFDGFEPRQFLLEYAATYFSTDEAAAIADLYRDYYDSYWEQRKPTLDMDRQFIFHDLRMSRALRHLTENLLKENDGVSLTPRGLRDKAEAYFQIVPKDTDNSRNEMDALIEGTRRSALKLKPLMARSRDIAARIDPDRRVFFEDSLLAQIEFLYYCNTTLNILARSSRSNLPKETRMGLFREAEKNYRHALAVLKRTERGLFTSWYPWEGGRDLFGLVEIGTRLRTLATGGKQSVPAIEKPK